VFGGDREVAGREFKRAEVHLATSLSSSSSFSVSATDTVLDKIKRIWPLSERSS